MKQMKATARSAHVDQDEVRLTPSRVVSLLQVSANSYSFVQDYAIIICKRAAGESDFAPWTFTQPNLSPTLSQAKTSSKSTAASRSSTSGVHLLVS
jgi:hypothetical protein